MAAHQDDQTEAEYGTGQKTLKAYLIGVALCIILTLIPFALVAKHSLDTQNLYIALTLFALAQLYVQVVFFLRLNASPKGRTTLLSFLFTLLIVLVLVMGSLWIMYNLNYNMAH